MIDFKRLKALAKKHAIEAKLGWRDDFVLNGIAYNEKDDRYNLYITKNARF